jgi:hypothetical protein
MWFAQFNPPRALAGWERPKGQAPLTSVRLRAAYEGDAVRLKVAAVFDDSEPADAPGPKYGAREREVESFLAREGETFTVEGFRDLGREPLVLKVVRAEPEPEMPLVPVPTRAVSRLKSVEVVGFAPGGAHLERGTLTVVNLSQKGIVALEMNVPERDYTHTLQAAGGRVLAAPGVTYRTEIGFPRGGRRTANGYEPEPQADALVIVSAVFEDGTYEGSTKGAAKMTAWQRGRLTQFARALALVQNATAADSLAGLKSQVEGLRIDAEPALVDELLAQFPKLSGEEGRRLVAEAALGGMRAAKEETLRLFEGGPDADARRRLETIRVNLEHRAGARRD